MMKHSNRNNFNPKHLKSKEVLIHDSNLTCADFMKRGLQDRLLKIIREYGFWPRLEDFRVRLKVNRARAAIFKEAAPEVLPYQNYYARLVNNARWMYIDAGKVKEMSMQEFVIHSLEHHEPPFSKEADIAATNFFVLQYESMMQELAKTIKEFN